MVFSALCADAGNGLIEVLRALFRIFDKHKRPEESSSDPELLWAYPLSRLIDKAEPFSNFEPPGTKVQKRLRSLCISTCIGHTFLLYLGLVEKYYGAEVSLCVRMEQKARLNMVLPEFGAQLEQLLVLVGDGLELASGKALSLVPAAKKLPPEFYVANYILLSVTESPFYGNLAALTERDGLPSQEMHDATFDLAECLVWTRDKAIEHFTPVLTALRIDARDLKAWVDSKIVMHVSQSKANHGLGGV